MGGVTKTEAEAEERDMPLRVLGDLLEIQFDFQEFVCCSIINIGPVRGD